MTQTELRVMILVADPAVKKQLETMVRSVRGVTLHGGEDPLRTDLLICQLGKKSEKDFERLRRLASFDAYDELFLISDSQDQAVLMTAMQLGTREFFSEPLEEKTLTDAMERFVERKRAATERKPRSLGRIINVLGSKGGVGTTTVAVNLAVSLAQRKAPSSVGLVDMNLLFGDIPLFLEIKSGFDWSEITRNVDRLDQTFLTNIMARHSTGVHVLPSPGYLNGHPAATPEIMSRLIEVMQTMFDFVVIDGGHAIDPPSLKVVELSDTVVLVSVLSLPCLSNTSKLLQSFSFLGYPDKERIRIVINRYMSRSEISLDDAEKGIDHTIFWTIPNDYQSTISAINQGKPLSQTFSKAPITRNIREMAGALVQGESAHRKTRSGLFRRHRKQAG